MARDPRARASASLPGTTTTWPVSDGVYSPARGEAHGSHGLSATSPAGTDCPRRQHPVATATTVAGRVWPGVGRTARGPCWKPRAAWRGRFTATADPCCGASTPGSDRTAPVDVAPCRTRVRGQQSGPAIRRRRWLHTRNRKQKPTDLRGDAGPNRSALTGSHRHAHHAGPAYQSAFPAACR